jgi:ubiquinone/menaquinone biosynthesis C-methylase UbiE
MNGNTLNAAPASALHVPESRFGVWFLSTDVWSTHVLRRAIADLLPLISRRRAFYEVVADIGCGWGRSFALLQENFAPQRMIGIDLDAEMLKKSAETVQQQGLNVELHQGSCSQLPLADASVDLLLCHQTFHHLVEQDAALREFIRVLKPGGVLLFAESTRKYIHSWIIRLLFRHPMDVQRTADEYLAMLRAAGFTIDASSISYPYLWWSRSDLGVMERWFGLRPRATREETLINLAAVKLYN